MFKIIKICGLSTPAAVAAALGSGADMVGFVFFPRSPRNVTPAQAMALGEPIAGRARKVALTVDADDETIDAIRATLAPDMFQLHGRETPERAAGIRKRAGVPVMKAIGVAGPDDVAQAARFRDAADMILFDAKPPAGAAAPGGNGLAFEWALLRNADPGLPWLLSGGLDAANVGDAIRLTGAIGVDVSSGVETAPGLKDPGLIRAFVRAARALSTSGASV